MGRLRHDALKLDSPVLPTEVRSLLPDTHLTNASLYLKAFRVGRLSPCTLSPKNFAARALSRRLLPMFDRHRGTNNCTKQ
eukprot:555303-Pleurochrysis_carterae.AAC.3